METNDTIISFLSPSTEEVGKRIALRVKSRRLAMNLSQEGLSVRADVKLATYRKFERTGLISLSGLLKIAFALDGLKDFEELFASKHYESLDDVLRENDAVYHKRKRGTKNE